MGFQFVKTSVEEPIAVVSINNPPVNVLSRAVFEDVHGAIAEFSSNPRIKCIILTGEGSNFVAGAVV